MSGDNLQTVDEELIAKFFSQETSREENERIRQWRGADAANERQFNTWKVVWSDTGHLRSWDPPVSQDLDDAFAKVRIRRDQLLAEQKAPVPLAQWIWRVAAVLIMGVGIGWFVLSSKQSDPLEFVATTDVITSSLDDGTTISLNVGSRLEVKNQSEEKREVYLEGEAYFEVVPDPQRPFIVQTELVKVEVLGTSFNVSATDETMTLVSVEEGRVRLSIGDQELILVGGQTGSYDHLTRDLKLLEVEDTGEHRFWKTRKLVFREQTLAEVVSILNRTYDQPILLARDELGTCLLTVNFEDESIENILEVISITLGLQLTEVDNEIVIDGEGC